jgi:hypothetical protein
MVEVLIDLLGLPVTLGAVDVQGQAVFFIFLRIPISCCHSSWGPAALRQLYKMINIT